MREPLRKIVLVLFLALVTVPVFLCTAGNLSHKSYLSAFCISCVLTLLLWAGRGVSGRFQNRINTRKPVIACVVLSLLCLLINGAFASLFHPVQAADYRTFFQVAKDLAAGNHPGMKDYVAMFPHILGYSSFLSVFLRLFGQNLSVAIALNVVLTTVSGIALFWIIYKLTDTFSASAAYCLWIICPSKLFYNTMSLSEPYYTCLLLLFILLVTGISVMLNRGERPRYVLIAAFAMLSGVILTLVQSSRPIAAVPLLALVIWVLLLMRMEDLRRTWKGWALFILITIVCYAAGQAVWKNYAAEQLEQLPPSLPGYNIYVGFNLETNGSYSDEDMTLFQDRYFGEYERDAESAQQSMLADAKMRIAAAGSRLPRLMLEKLKTLLGHDEGGVFYAMESLSTRQYRISCMVSNIWYYLVCILTVTGTIRIWQSGECGTILVAVLFVVGLILAQMLVEVAARYHYSLIPMLLLVSAYNFPHRYAPRLTA